MSLWQTENLKYHIIGLEDLTEFWRFCQNPAEENCSSNLLYFEQFILNIKEFVKLSILSLPEFILQIAPLKTLKYKNN